jgi:hypothetical protein
MMILLISSTLIIGAITGFVFFSEGEFFCGVAGQALHGLLSFVCFALVGVAFSRFGWKVGIIDLGLLFIASNTVTSVLRIPQKEVGYAIYL